MRLEAFRRLGEVGRIEVARSTAFRSCVSAGG